MKNNKSDQSKLLDTVFSQYIRLLEADGNGICYCVSCSRRMHWTEAQAGHFNSRRHMSTRWMKENVNCQCQKCNIELCGNLEAYRENLVFQYGEEYVQQLENMKNIEAKFSESDISEMMKKYRKEVSRLKEDL